ncbi:type II toxin-antitoxin system RelE/ParE family toxin, partial [Vibrio anguillarum]|nr:type II toxin-antitoxin system RelE/ParE family toxin [Vibrio anguillarum]
MANSFENNILLRQIDNKGDFMVLKFAFVNDAAEREYKKLPEDIQDEFGKDLRKLQFGQTP